jgi:hypothetical protein
MKLSTGSVLLGVATTAVIAAVVGGLFLIGSPAEERARRLDSRRVTDLQRIRAATDLYWTRHSRLPASLDELSGEPGVRITTRDPESGETYRYETMDSARYEVCASFERPSDPVARNREMDLWAHDAGPQCFRLDAEEIAGAERSDPGPGRAGRPG